MHSCSVFKRVYEGFRPGPLPLSSKYGTQTILMGIFWSESIGLTGFMFPSVLLGFCLFVSQPALVCYRLPRRGQQGQSGGGGWAPVCRGLPSWGCALPNLRRMDPSLGVATGEVASLAQLLGAVCCQG